MPYKLDENGHIVTQEVNGQKLPLFVHGDGREAPFDAENTLGTISRLNSEARGHREAKEAAEAKLKGFEGIEDGEAARKALETVKSLSAGELKTAAQVQEIKDAAAKSAQEAVAAATRAAQEKERALTEQNNKLTKDLNDHVIGSAFKSSEFIMKKMAENLPPDMVQAYFGHHFSVEDGKLVAKDNGNPIYSATDHGNLAGFDEAISLLVNKHPKRDALLRGSGASGSGAHSGQGGGGGKTMPRAQFNALAPQARMDAIKGGTTVTD